MGQAGVPPMVKLQRDSVLLTVGTFINTGIGLEDVVRIHDGILLNHKRNEIMSFAATWIITPSEVSQNEKDKYHTSCICEA